MRLVINFRKQETNIPLTCIFIYTVQTKVQTKLAQYIPPPPNYLGGWGRAEEKKKKKGKEMCNVFRACLNFEEDILIQNR